MKNWINTTISVVAMIISLVAIAKVSPTLGVDFDYLGAVIGVLSFLVTLLLGFQIYTVINVKEELKDVKRLREEMDLRLNAKGEEISKAFKLELQNAVPVIIAIASKDSNVIEGEVFKTYKEAETGQLAKDLAEQSILTLLLRYSSIPDDSQRRNKLEDLAQNVNYEEVIEFYTDFAKSDNMNLPDCIEDFLLELIGILSKERKDGDKK